MCSRYCTGVFSEPTYGLKVSFVYVYKTSLLLYKATTLHGVRSGSNSRFRLANNVIWTSILVNSEFSNPPIHRLKEDNPNKLFKHRYLQVTFLFLQKLNYLEILLIIGSSGMSRSIDWLHLSHVLVQKRSLFTMAFRSRAKTRRRI